MSPNLLNFSSKEWEKTSALSRFKEAYGGKIKVLHSCSLWSPTSFKNMLIYMNERTKGPLSLNIDMPTAAFKWVGAHLVNWWEGLLGISLLGYSQEDKTS